MKKHLVLLCTVFACLATKPLHGFFQRFLDNFHTVEKNKLYRSGQLSSKRLKHYIAKYGIKTVINLRGKHPELAWWQNEHNITRQCGAVLHNVSMNSRYLPSKKKLITLVNLYKEAPKPILIHCLSGADRTGEAAALWVLQQQKLGKRQALKQLSLRYGYFKRRKPAKHFLISIWQDFSWLVQHYKPAMYPNFYP